MDKYIFILCVYTNKTWRQSARNGFFKQLSSFQSSVELDFLTSLCLLSLFIYFSLYILARQTTTTSSNSKSRYFLFLIVQTHEIFELFSSSTPPLLLYALVSVSVLVYSSRFITNVNDISLHIFLINDASTSFVDT